MKEVNKQYIRKIIQEYLKDNDLKCIFLYRLKQIPFEEQEQLFLNEIQILLPHTMSSPLFRKRVGLNECENISLPLNKVKQTILKQYNFKDWQFIIRTFENNVDIAILIPNTDTYIKELINDMNVMGYFCSLTQNITYNGLTYKAMRFEPLYQPNIRDKEIDDNILYHLTPISNVENIKRVGLLPLSKNKYFNYPNRIYFLKSNITVREIRELARGFQNTTEVEDDYVLLVIDLTKIPNNVSFHNDPSLANAVYTYDKVPSTAIVNILELHINKQ